MSNLSDGSAIVDTILNAFSGSRQEDKGAEAGAEAGAQKKGSEKAKGEASKHKGSWWRLLGLTRPELHWTLLGMAGALAAGAMNPLFGLFLINVRTSSLWPLLRAPSWLPLPCWASEYCSLRLRCCRCSALPLCTSIGGGRPGPCCRAPPAAPAG